jgi:hypothetical protein
MIDFLRSNAWCSREEYMWGMTVGQVRLSSFDFSRIKSGGNNGKDGRKNLLDLKSSDDLKNLSDLGIPIIKKQ